MGAAGAGAGASVAYARRANVEGCCLDRSCDGDGRVFSKKRDDDDEADDAEEKEFAAPRAREAGVAAIR